MGSRQRQRARDVADLPPRQQRYPGGDSRSPGDVSNSETIADETRRGVIHWAHNHPYLTTILGVLALPLVGLILLLVTRWAPGFFSDPWVQRIGGVGTLVVISVVGGRAWQRADIERMDELELFTPNGLKTFKGTFETTADDDLVFEPVKGWTFFGHKANPYTVEEISASLAEDYRAANRDPNDSARILLLPPYTRVTRTEYGTRAVQLTSELVPEPFANHAALSASPPPLADEDALDDANDLIEDLRDEKNGLESKITALERQKADAEERARKRVDDILDTFIDRQQDVADAVYPRRRDGRSSTTIGPRPQQRETLEDGKEVYLNGE